MKNTKTNYKPSIAKSQKPVKKKNRIDGVQPLNEFMAEARKSIQRTSPSQNKKANTWKIHPSEKQWRLDMRKLKPIHRCILIDLRFYARTDNIAWPSIPTLAQNLNVSESTIKRAMPLLAKKRFVKIVKKLGQNNLYKINISF